MTRKVSGTNADHFYMQYSPRILRRQRRALSALVAISLSAALSPFGLLPAAADTARPFSSTSFWNAPLATNTPVSPDSAILTGDITSQISRYYGAASVNTTTYTPTIYTVGASQPNVKFAYNNCQNKTFIDTSFIDQISAVPVPPNAIPASGTDGEMIVYQPSTDTVWELWRVQKSSTGAWSACWGGRLKNVSTGDGTFPKWYGVTASGVSMLGGTMRIDELQRGSIDHAISMSIPEVRKTAYSWPANRTDGWVDGTSAIAEGQRFRLDPSVNVDALNLTPMAKMMAKAMQTYGVIVRDRAGAVSFTAENAQPTINATGVNPYTQLMGSKPWAVMSNFPWDKLQALPFGYRPATTTTSSTSLTPTTTTALTTTTTSPPATTTTTTATPATTTTSAPATTTTTTAGPTTTTSALATTTTTIAPTTTSAWMQKASVVQTSNGLAVVGTFTAPTPTAGSYLLDVQVHEATTNKKLYQAYVTLPMSSGQTATVSLPLPANIPPGTYQVHQGTFSPTWTMYAWANKTARFTVS